MAQITLYKCLSITAANAQMTMAMDSIPPKVSSLQIGETFDQFTAARGHPFLRFCPLTAWAVPITAGSIVDLFITAFRTDAFCKAELAGLALHDAPGGAFLFRCDCVFGTVIRIEHPERFTDQVFGHRFSPPCPWDW